MSFEEWWGTRNRKSLLLDSGDKGLAEKCYQAGKAEQKEKDAVIAGTLPVYACKEIASAIRNQEEAE